MVKRESLSPFAPPPPPQARHPPPLQPDHDELDCLPLLPNKRVSPARPSPRPVKRTRVDEERRAPTLPEGVMRGTGRSRSAKDLQTPSQSPQNSREGRRVQQGASADERRDEVDFRMEKRVASGSRGLGKSRASGSADALASDSAQKATKPSPSRRPVLVFKSSSSSGGGEREHRARLRAEQAETFRSQRSQGRTRSNEEGQGEEEQGDEPPGKESRAETALRRRKLVRGQAPEANQPSAALLTVKREPSIEVEGFAPLPSPSRPRPRPYASSSSSTPRQRQPPAPVPNASSSSMSCLPTPARAPPSPALPSQPAPAPSSSTPPTLSTFLSSLPLPSLTRLTPHFHSLGLSSPADLVQLSNSSSEGARRARGRVLLAVSKAAEGDVRGEGAMTEWERIVLEEELEEGWKRWGQK
ncbi:hypothetical protein JCM11251_006668 [Rhodosporidiobolus azoricus]